MDPLASLENAIGADLLRSKLLRAPLPRVGDRYTVQGFLGRGAMGLVVSALDDRLGRSVALKLAIAGADSATLVEARALAALDHPNIVRVHDVDVLTCVFEGKSFRLWVVSMQMVPGQTMRAWISSEAPDLRRVLGAFIDAGRGLAAAHEARIVHRDFKLDNVIVRRDGIAQVLDFGFAVPAPSAYSNFGTVLPHVAGTDPYMAPEARQGRANRRSDQYAFGVSMVEAFVGEPLPARGPPPAGVPSGLWAVMRRATHDKADKRYPTMTGVLVGLEQALRATSRVPRARFRGVVFAAAVGVFAYMWVTRPAEVIAAFRGIRTHAHGSFAWVREATRSVTRAHDNVAAQAPAAHSERHDGGSPGIREPDGPSPARTAIGTTAPSASPVEPPRTAPRCPSFVGRYLLTTHLTTPNREDIARIGSYVLSIEEASIELRKRMSGSDDRHMQTIDAPLTNTWAWIGTSCVLTLEATLRERVYVFTLEVDPPGLTGDFTASGDHLGEFGGTVSGERFRGR